MRGLGRINRTTYWAAVALMFVVAIAVQLLTHPEFNATGMLLIVIAVPRLHDMGRSGWWAVGVLMLEIGAGIAMGKLVPPAILMQVIGATTFVVLALVILVGLLRGQDGANRYGHAPSPGISYAPEPERAA